MFMYNTKDSLAQPMPMVERKKVEPLAIAGARFVKLSLKKML